MSSKRPIYKFTKTKISFKFIVLLLVITPLVIIPGLSHLAWKVSPSEKLDIVFMDKTVPDKERLEHRSLFWMLKHLKIKRVDGEFYQYDKDYFGFYPDDNGLHKTKSLKNFDESALDSISKSIDALYIADTYGVYEADFQEKDKWEFSRKIYGGLSENDFRLIKNAIKHEKLLIAEFNTMGAPTSANIRKEFEEVMGLKWTGWISRYFDELDTLINTDLPKWLVANYKAQHNANWPFKGAGQVFVSESGKIEILETQKDIRQQLPKIVSTLKSQQNYNLPSETNYPYWFEIVRIDKAFEVISYFDLNPTEAGLKKLQDMGLPRYFPAAMVKLNGKGKIYYFTGDFSDNPIDMGSAPFWGVPTLKKLINDNSDYSNRTSFYWNYFYPLAGKILNENAY